MKRVPAVLLAALGLPIYALYLQWSPVHLHHDELFFALNAHAIASSGHDINGRFMPLYFQVSDRVWFHPVLVYLMTPFVKVLPLHESVIRFPVVLAGLIDVFLMYLIARRVFTRDLLAVAAAGMLTLTPAHFIHSRLAMDYLLPVPFVMGWLLCLLIFLERRQSWILFAGTACLGIGFYSYGAAVVMMPVYLVVTGFVLFQQTNRPRRAYLAAALGFALPLLPLMVWLHAHPTAYADQISRYQIYDSSRLNPLRGLRQVLSYASLSERISVFYNYFNPSFLFFSGDAAAIDSTRQAGVFLLPVAVFLPAGIVQIAKQWRTGINTVLLLGFVTAPLAAALVGEPFRIARALVMLPFGTLIAMKGVESCLTARDEGLRIVGALLLALIPVQFGYFYHDYLTDYRVRSSVWFDGNMRGVLEEVIAGDGNRDVPAVYLSKDIGWIDSYWRLCLIEHAREDLLQRTVYFDPQHEDLLAAPGRSLVLSRLGDALGKAHETGQANEALVRTGDLRRVTVISGPDRRVAFEVLERR